MSKPKERKPGMLKDIADIAKTVVSDALFNRQGAMTAHKIESMSQHPMFSSNLPFYGYDDNPDFSGGESDPTPGIPAFPGTSTGLYINADETAGVVFKCNPLYFAGEQTAEQIKGLFNLGFPGGTTIQFIMHADRYLAPFIEDFRTMGVKRDPITKNCTESFAKFMEEGAHGIPALGGLPLRDYKLYVAVKFPAGEKGNFSVNELTARQISGVRDVLAGAGLAPEELKPKELINWLGRLYNGEDVPEAGYDETKDISKQIINSGVLVEDHLDHLKVGKRYWKCLSVKSPPKDVDTFQTRQLVGGIWGVRSDTAQIRVPFVQVTTLIFDDAMKTHLHLKCSVMLKQQAIGSAKVTHDKAKSEFAIAADMVEGGTVFVRAIQAVWFYHEDKKTVESAASTAEKIVYGKQQYLMQHEWGIQVPMFLLMHPFGFYNVGKNLQLMNRDNIYSEDAASRMLPIQAGFRGAGLPMTVYVDRNGQVVPIDYFSYNSYNSLVCASTGKGKSFLKNAETLRYLAADCQIFIMDIGRSYEKLCGVMKGKFLRFHEKADICLNPFTLLKGSDARDDGLPSDIPALADIIMAMVYSRTKAKPHEVEVSLAKEAVQYAWEKAGNEGDITLVREYLNMYPRLHKDYSGEIRSGAMGNREITGYAHKMAFNLGDFVKGGVYGKWFNGRMNFDISQDQFAVLELEELNAMPDLFRVVTLQVMDYVTKALYLGDVNRRKLILIDEAHMFLKGEGEIKELVEQAYRRARKYNAGVSIITQSVLDLPSFAGGVGRVIWNNSAFRFLLESSDYEAASKASDPYITYDGFTLELLKSVKTVPGKFSEIFMDTPYGQGVGRLIVPRELYYMFSTHSREVAMTKKLMEGYLAEMKAGSKAWGGQVDGGDQDQYAFTLAISEMVRRERGESLMMDSGNHEQ